MVFALVEAPGPRLHAEIAGSIAKMVADVAAYVPGYRLKQDVQVTEIASDQPVHTLLAGDAGGTARRPTHQVSVFLEVEGAAHYLPAYAGNLDIMTSAGLQVAERIAARRAAR
jgi:acetaldehyde dehydrogenase